MPASQILSSLGMVLKNSQGRSLRLLDMMGVQRLVKRLKVDPEMNRQMFDC